jgi:HAE1 family hydrophobic/amphiphilic exporter-1
MTSVNSLGSTQITLEFDLNRGLDGAAVDVQGAITQAQRLLPQGMPTPPTFAKVNPADQPILYLVVTSTTLPPWTLDEYAETRIAQRISQVSGVAQVQVLGSQKYAVHAQIDPRSMAARQIDQRSRERCAPERERADRLDHRPAPGVHAAGDRAAHQPSIQEHGDLMRRRAVRLGELGTSTASRTAHGIMVLHAGRKQRAITLGIQRQPGTNTIAVADAGRRCCRPAPSCRPACTSTSSTTARTPSVKLTTCSSPWC